MSDTNLRPYAAGSVVLGAVAVMLASHGDTGGRTLLVVLGVLGLVLSVGWPAVAGSRTPKASAVVMALSVVVLAIPVWVGRFDWVAAAVAVGIVLSFFHQLRRTKGRGGLVVTLMAAFGGLAVVTSGMFLTQVGGQNARSEWVMVAMAAVISSLAGDLTLSVPKLRAFAPLLALVVALLVVPLVARGATDPSTAAAIGIGALTSTLSFATRRVFAMAPGMLTTRGQVAVGLASVLVVGALTSALSLVG